MAMQQSVDQQVHFLDTVSVSVCNPVKSFQCSVSFPNGYDVGSDMLWETLLFYLFQKLCPRTQGVTFATFWSRLDFNGTADRLFLLIALVT